MQKVNTLSDDGEYPIVEAGMLVRWGEKVRGKADPKNESVSKVENVWIDEDGAVQLVVTDSHQNTPEDEHSISLQDLYGRMERQEFEVLD
jgi:hypothetical protein